MKPLHKQRGIYQIINKVTGRRYVGMTRANFILRWKRHYEDLKRGVHHNSRLQRDFNRYGAGCFKFVVIEVIEDIALIEPRELFYINQYARQYEIYNVKDVFIRK